MVWAIEEGAYSEYHIVGVFSTRENAERILAILNADRQVALAELVEWPLDPCIEQLNAGLSQWRVIMLKDGSVEKTEHFGGAYGISADFQVSMRSTWRHGDNPKPDCIDPIVWATDESHAVKIVNEHRAAMIASGEWR